MGGLPRDGCQQGSVPRRTFDTFCRVLCSLVLLGLAGAAPTRAGEPARWIVQGQPGVDLHRLVVLHGGRVTDDLHVIDAVAATLSAHRVANFVEGHVVYSQCQTRVMPVVAVYFGEETTELGLCPVRKPGARSLGKYWPSSSLFPYG